MPDSDCMTIVELTSPNVSTAQFKRLFETMCAESVDLYDECTSAEVYCTENGTRGKYETVVSTFKFPLLYERLIVNTRYNFFNYMGQEGAHISLSSSRGNEKFMNKESLGEKLFDGYRVVALVSIDGYCVTPLTPNGGTKLTFITKSSSSGIPFYLYKKFMSSKMSSAFDKILAKVQTY